MACFTATQGRYLSYVHAYTTLHGCAPAESEIATALCVSAPSVNQMVKMLERKGLISRQPGVPRSIEVLVPDAEIPPWRGRRADGQTATVPAGRTNHARWVPATSAAPAATLYELQVFLVGGPTGPKFAGKEISRAIEIRGDQTLEQLHRAIFDAYDRWDQHCYEFQFGRRPFDPAGPNYSERDPSEGRSECGDARTTTLDQLELKKDRVFGYWFDFGDDWYHQIQVNKIDTAIPTVRYPRVTRRVGKSPPQYDESEDADDPREVIQTPHSVRKKRSRAK